MNAITLGLLCGLGLLLIPLRVFALEDTTPQLIQWIIGLIEIIVLIIALSQVIPAIVYRARYKKIARLPESQVNEELKSQAMRFARKAKLHLRLLIIFSSIFVLLFAGWLVYYGRLSWSARTVIDDPCATNLGWENTPCTNIHDPVSEEILKKAKENESNVRNVLSWDAPDGRIYLAGMPGTDDTMFTVPQELGVNNGNSTPCYQQMAVTDGSFGTYSNARGEKIASCSAGYYKNPKICSWLMKLDLKDIDYADPECSR